jgi:hypothetical protein
MKESQLKVALPLTEDDFKALVDRVVKKYKFPNWDHAAAVIASRIAHSDVDQFQISIEYLGHCVWRNVAYQLATSMLSKMKHTAQVDEVISAIKSNPFDQQALDALDKAIADGSEYAKAQKEAIGL